MPRDQGVYVEGLKEFRKELRNADPQLRKGLQRAHKQIAEEVVEDARRRTNKQHIKRAMTPRGSQRRAEIGLLGARAPDIFGWEFGAKQYRQFPDWRGNRWSDPSKLGVGYMVHPAIRDYSDELNETYLDRVEQAMRPAFPDRP